MLTKFEVVIIGGGPGGATAAILLARAGWSVAVVEKAPFPRRKVCGEYISATNLPLFQQIGITEVFEERAGPEIRQVGIFARDTILLADMPRSRESPGGWGRALGREHLDTMLLARAAEIKQPKKLTAQVVLKDFVIPNTELIPEEVRSKVKKWSDFIDYWAVDWDFQNDTFMQGWVAYRTRKERKLPLACDPHTYEKPGKYRILVKVIDIFGNDTSQAFDVEVK